MNLLMKLKKGISLWQLILNAHGIWSLIWIWILSYNEGTLQSIISLRQGNVSINLLYRPGGVKKNHKRKEIKRVVLSKALFMKQDFFIVYSY